jgi:uncharacterized protein YbjT (DUF2867 family)
MATYLVTQATGHQAQWTIQHLLAAGAKVHAVVRNPQKIPSILESPGVSIFKGESINFEDISRAAQGCRGVYLNTFPIPGMETQQAKTIVDACKKAGVKTVVACTAMGTGTKAIWDDQVTEESQLRGYYRSKAEVEDVVRKAGFEAYTILRPGFIHVDYFLPNAYVNYPELPTKGELAHGCEDGARVPHTDANDIGKYAAAALLNPDKFAGQEVEVVSDNLTVQEVRDILVKVSGREVRVRRRTPEEYEAVRSTVFGQKFHQMASAKEFSASMTAAKEAAAKLGIPLTPLEAALRRDKDRLLECLPA